MATALAEPSKSPSMMATAPSSQPLPSARAKTIPAIGGGGTATINTKKPRRNKEKAAEDKKKAEDEGNTKYFINIIYFTSRKYSSMKTSTHKYIFS